MIDASGRGRPTRLWHLSGLVSGGTAAGLLLGLFAALFPPWQPLTQTWVTVTLGAGLTLVAALRDAGAVRIPLPENRRQVRQTVLRAPADVGAFHFGFELGTGMRTYLPGTAPYLLLLWSFAVGVPWTWIVMAGTGFGLGRWLLLVDRELSRSPPGWDTVLARDKRRVSLVGTGMVGGTLTMAALLHL